jgi:DNA-binding winged helix-turn-helix (wHTH) protein/Tfp pilus assembly protein PilF
MGSTSTLPELVRFGVFQANIRSGELRRDGNKIKMQDLPFRALVLLLSRPGEVISHIEFRRALWPEDVFVDFERALRSAIKRLRDALGDNSENPIFVETVERRGYRWIAPVANAVTDLAQSPITPQVATPPEKLMVLRWLFIVPLVAILCSAYIVFWGHDRVIKSHPSGHYVPNREAEQLYLKGRFYWEKRTPDSLHQAVDAFTQAIVHDPNYAEAYVGLADCYNLLREYTAMPGNEAFERAYAASEKAVELDDSSSEAHASLAFVLYNGMWRIPEADREFRRAIELDPRNVKAHHWWATSLDGMRRFPEAVREIDAALRLYPGSRAILADKAEIFFDAGRHDEGMQILMQLEQAEPDFRSPHRYLAGEYLKNRDYPRYLVEMRKTVDLQQDATGKEIVEAAERGYKGGGEAGLLSAELEVSENLYRAGKLSPWQLAAAYGRLGQTQQAMRYLNVCYETHCDEMNGTYVEAAFYKLHQLPEFQQLMVKVGLAPVNS